MVNSTDETDPALDYHSGGQLSRRREVPGLTPSGDWRAAFALKGASQARGGELTSESEVSIVIGGIFDPVTMLTIQAYLQSPKTRKVLSRKPGEEGFSLIELVVVVAVLAILAAIAIPSFTSINDKARASAASNTLAQVIKQCAVDEANGIAAPTYGPIALDGYTAIPAGTTCPNTASPTATITSTTPAKYASFTYNITTKAKTCVNASTPGCDANGNW